MKEELLNKIRDEVESVKNENRKMTFNRSYVKTELFKNKIQIKNYHKSF